MTIIHICNNELCANHLFITLCIKQPQYHLQCIENVFCNIYTYHKIDDQINQVIYCKKTFEWSIESSEWTSRILIFPITSWVTIIFSIIAPSGMLMQSPWLAIIITVPFTETRLPKVTSPETDKWLSSRISGMDENLDKKSLTYVL